MFYRNGQALHHMQRHHKEGWGNVKGFDKEIQQFIKQHDLFSKGSRILVACSGGVDSMTLLHYLWEHQEDYNVKVGAVHVDHMLRGEESAADGRFVQSYCENLGIPFYGGNVPVPAILKQQGGNVQTVCREGRYAFFDEIMQRHAYHFLATAHHAEDQLETVCMQIAKGIHPHGMPIRRIVTNGLLIRPFLPVDKATLYTYAKERQIPFREDPSNQQDAYMRNRIRHHVVPHFVKENPSVVNRIVPLTNELREDHSFLLQLTEEWLASCISFTKNGYPSMRVKAFCDMPTALQRRAIPLLLNYLYDKENNAIFYKSDLIRQLLEHLQSDQGNAVIDLPGGFQFIRSYDWFIFEPKQEIDEKRMVLPQGEKVYWHTQTWFYWEDVHKLENDILLNAKEIAFFNLPKASLPLSVRQRKEGDRMTVKGMTNAKRLSRLFIDEKVNRHLRDRLPILVTSKDEVCGIPELRYNYNFTTEQTAESKYIFVVGTN